MENSTSVAVRVDATNIVPAIWYTCPLQRIPTTTTQTAKKLRNACITATVATYTLIRPMVAARRLWKCEYDQPKRVWGLEDFHNQHDKSSRQLHTLSTLFYTRMCLASLQPDGGDDEYRACNSTTPFARVALQNVPCLPLLSKTKTQPTGTALLSTS